MLRALIAVSFAALVALSSATAAAAPPGETCFGAYESAQSSRKAGHVIQAKSELELCIGSCPTALAGDCKRWLGEVEAKVAELTLQIVGGAAATSARVEVDGLVRDASGPLQLDPGPHVIRVIASGFSPSERHVDLEPGGKKTVVVQLVPLRTDRIPEGPSPRPRSIAPFVLGGVGLAAMAGGGALSLVGWLDVKSMRDSCAPAAGGAGCPASRIDRVRAEWIAGGVLVGAGAAAFSSAVIWVAVRGPAPETTALSLGVRRGAPTLALDGRF